MRLLIAAAATLAIAACGQQSAEAPPAAPAEAAPPSLMQQAQARAAEMQPVFAWELLRQYQAAHPEAQPPCESIRRAESRGVVPANVAPDSIYAPHVGALVFAVQCGPQRTDVRANPREHWLIVLAPGAMEPHVEVCADERGLDRCALRAIPLAE